MPRRRAAAALQCAMRQAQDLAGGGEVRLVLNRAGEWWAIAFLDTHQAKRAALEFATGLSPPADPLAVLAAVEGAGRWPVASCQGPTATDAVRSLVDVLRG